MRIKLVALRLFALAAMAVCTAMLLDYLLPTPAFCGFRSGCEQVTRSIYGRPLAVPLPLWGLAAFGTFYSLTLFPAGRLGRLIGPAAILAGVGGLSFILLQLLVIRRVCPLCMVIDACGLFITATELLAATKTAPSCGTVSRDYLVFRGKPERRGRKIGLLTFGVFRQTVGCSEPRCRPKSGDATDGNSGRPGRQAGQVGDQAGRSVD